jgi:hypothetical protein
VTSRSRRAIRGLTTLGSFTSNRSQREKIAPVGNLFGALGGLAGGSIADRPLGWALSQAFAVILAVQPRN